MIRILTGVAIGVMIVAPQTRGQFVQILHNVWNLGTSIAHTLIGAF